MRSLHNIFYRLARNISNDFLDRSEASGGHAIDKHIGQTNEDLIKRANQEGVASTSFTDKSTANNAIKENVQKNASDVESWLKNPNSQNTLVINASHNFEIGKGVEVKNGGNSASKQVTYGLDNSRVVLVKDSSMKEGFRIQTAFPVFK